ncbi:hypothetical protein [Streptomyces boninensis]|uniref:hypothetical protein n=1 Tax=Streptomyces boninensis TaxID=2039455 RepID=UPI003B215C43
MQPASAVELVEQMIYKPGWEFHAREFTDRFEGAICVEVRYPTYNSNRDEAERGYQTPITGQSAFPLVVADGTIEDLCGTMLDLILKIEEHEAREFLRLRPTDWAPFHPHRVEGMRRWLTRRQAPDFSGDLLFGIA